MFARSVLARSVGVPSRLAHIRLPAVRMQHVIAMAAAEEGKKLYVGNLAWGASQNDLYTLFGKYGEVSDAFIPTDRETGRPRGFAFVTLDAEGADAAVAELDGSEFQGRALRVNEAQPQQPRTGGGGRGGGFRRGGGGGGRGGYGRGGGGGSSYNYDSY